MYLNQLKAPRITGSALGLRITIVVFKFKPIFTHSYKPFGLRITIVVFKLNSAWLYIVVLCSLRITIVVFKWVCVHINKSVR